MNKKHQITRKITQMVIETKKEKPDDWPVGDRPEPPITKGGDWPLAIKGDRPLGEILRTKPQMTLFTKKVRESFGVQVRLSKATKLGELATTIHSNMEVKEK
jgi:hypothetical protein